MGYLANFECLDFDAARKAKAWLETNISAGVLPLDTYLAFSEDEAELFGFIVLEEIDVKVAPEDVPIMQMRNAVDNPRAEKQKAVKLVWIARSDSSDPGFGGELFDHALLVALEAGACALMVEPFDDKTADELWLRHYHLRRPRDGADEWSCLWHAVGEADQTWG
jgi:hypothetical protein